MRVNPIVRIRDPDMVYFRMEGKQVFIVGGSHLHDLVDAESTFLTNELEPYGIVAIGITGSGESLMARVADMPAPVVTFEHRIDKGFETNQTRAFEQWHNTQFPNVPVASVTTLPFYDGEISWGDMHLT